LKFDVDQAVANARQVNPELRLFFTSAITGEGMDQWYAFLRDQVRATAPA
jgi:hydrogenase nickel incorporation protein HypB